MPVFRLHEDAGCSADLNSTPHLKREMWSTVLFRTVVVALYVPSALWHYEFSGEMNGRDTETVLTMYIAYETRAGSNHLILIIQMKAHVVFDGCVRIAVGIQGIEEKGRNQAIGAGTLPASKYWGDGRSYRPRRRDDAAVGKCHQGRKSDSFRKAVDGENPGSLHAFQAAIVILLEILRGDGPGQREDQQSSHHEQNVMEVALCRFRS